MLWRSIVEAYDVVAAAVAANINGAAVAAAAAAGGDISDGRFALSFAARRGDVGRAFRF